MEIGVFLDVFWGGTHALCKKIFLHDVAEIQYKLHCKQLCMECPQNLADENVFRNFFDGNWPLASCTFFKLSSPVPNYERKDVIFNIQ